MKTHQIIYFENGFRKSVMNITGIKEGSFTHLELSDGRTILVNTKKVLMVEVIPEDMAEATWGSLANKYHVNYPKWGKEKRFEPKTKQEY